METGAPLSLSLFLPPSNQLLGARTHLLETITLREGKQQGSTRVFHLPLLLSSLAGGLKNRGSSKTSTAVKFRSRPTTTLDRG